MKEKIVLTDERKTELDNYSEEEIIFLWSAFTQQEIDYIEGVDNEVHK
jgi:energy-coupling factor transporter ATP-binding protein EcfA2